jgi:hypothetical protein
MNDQQTLFSASRTKLARAGKFIRELEDSLTAYQESKPYRAQYATEANGQPAVEIEWACIPGHPEAVIGDCVHNLRGALDLMACDLVRAVNGNDNRVYFPFAHAADELDKAIKEKNFHRAGADAVELLKQYQPYRGGNNLLRGLHDLDIEDKHKALIVTGTTRDISLSVAYDVDHPEHGDFTVTASGIYFVLPADAEILPSVNVIQTLKDMMELVSSILKAFERLVAARTI